MERVCHDKISILNPPKPLLNRWKHTVFDTIFACLPNTFLGDYRVYIKRKFIRNITAKTKCTFSENEMYIFNSFFAS